jgi:uncharacterized protein
MKLHLNTTVGLNAITGHGDGTIAVNNKQVDHALIVMPNQIIDPWPIVDPLALSLADFAHVLALKPELVVFGSGKIFRFPDARILAAFSQARIGFEVMDTAGHITCWRVRGEMWRRRCWFSRQAKLRRF